MCVLFGFVRRIFAVSETSLRLGDIAASRFDLFMIQRSPSFAMTQMSTGVAELHARLMLCLHGMEVV